MEELPALPSKTSFLKRLRNVLLWILFSALGLVLALIVLLFVYEKEVKAAIVRELNKHLKTEVRIDPANIDLTIVKTFPYCSIEFKDLLMLEALPVKNRDTLLFAGRLNLHFNISDLWNKRYNIEKIKLKQVVAKLKVLKSGKTNYAFWKEDETSASETNDSLHFNLRLLAIDHCRLSYTNQQQLIKTALDIKSLAFKGNFGQSQFDLSSEAKLLIHQVTHKKTTYLKNKQLNFSVELGVNNKQYAFKKTHILLNNLALELNGHFAYKDSLENLNLSFNAPGLDIASALSLLPETFRSKINDYESSGHFYAKGNFTYSGKNNYKLLSDFGIKKGAITYRPQATEARQVNVEGNILLSPASSHLSLKNIYLRLKNDELKGSCNISNFSDPHLELSAEANLHLENLQAFFPIDTLTLLKGELTIRSEIVGNLKALKDETFSEKVKLDLSATVNNLEAGFKHDEQVYKVEHCAITARNREVEVSDLKLKRGSSDVTVNGKMPGLFNYLLDHAAPLIITGTLSSDHIKLEDFMPRSTQASAASETDLIPANMQFKLNAAISKFSFAKFIATSVSGEIDIKHQKAIISDMSLQTMQGQAEINAFADNSKHRLDVVLQSTLKSINIRELFAQLNNFGQTTLQDKNINGFASATIDFSGTWNNRLECDLRSVRSDCKLLIERGELIDFKPLLSLSRFVDLDDLKHIKFSTLQSNVSIDNSTITFPRTVIKNSALNIEFWGTHAFNNAIDYHIQLLLSELLSKKLKHKNDEEFGPIERDKDNTRSVFIRMTGTVDNPVLKYDRQGMKEKIKNDIKQEKQNIRQLLHEEFGLFKKDSTTHKNKADQVFELEKPDNKPTKKTLELKKKEEDDF